MPLKSKTAQEVVQAYLHHVYSKFGGSENFLSDNGTEELLEEVASQLEWSTKCTYQPTGPSVTVR